MLRYTLAYERTRPFLSHPEAVDQAACGEQMVRKTWIIGGALLIASGVLGGQFLPMFFAGQSVGVALFAAAILIFAFGLRASESLTARRFLGTAALVALALLAVVSAIMQHILFSQNDYLANIMTFVYIDSFVRFIVALTAVTQIARAGVIPRPWAWAPAWALLAVALVWLTTQIPFGQAVATDTVLAVNVGLVQLVTLGAPVFLGILAIVLANRTVIPRTVMVYPKSRDEDAEPR